MYHNRLIPCLLLKDQGLVKTVQFKNERYLGDPLNAVRIYNDKEVDELIFLDIMASRRGNKPDIKYLKKITEQCFMPVCYGGGIKTIDEIKELFEIGFEKISLNCAAYNNLNLITEAAEIFGSQSIVGSMDVKKDIFGNKSVYVLNGRKNTKTNPVQYAHNLESAGVGEILVNSIDNDGMMKGYDLETIEQVSSNVSVPVIACGGAGKIEDCNEVILSGASAAAAGSLFSYWGRKHAVLINYPNNEEIGKIIKN